MSRCSYPTGKMKVGCVHIVVYAVYAPLCDWFTPGAMHILSTVPQKLISTNQPIKGIININ